MKVLFFLFLSLVGSAGAQAKEDSASVELKNQLLEKINVYRKQHRLAPLVLENGLQRAAQNQCDYLFSIGKLSHTQPNKKYRTTQDRIRAFSRYYFTYFGENCLSVYADFMSHDAKTQTALVEEMFQLWRKSKPHNANLLYKNFTHADFAFRFNPETEEIFCVMDFGGK
ncbi:MAG: CAP domain-containing protein [Crocinitomicaceae bacterium]